MRDTYKNSKNSSDDSFEHEIPAVKPSAPQKRSIRDIPLSKKKALELETLRKEEGLENSADVEVEPGTPDYRNTSASRNRSVSSPTPEERFESNREIESNDSENEIEYERAPSPVSGRVRHMAVHDVQENQENQYGGAANHDSYEDNTPISGSQSRLNSDPVASSQDSRPIIQAAPKAPRKRKMKDIQKAEPAFDTFPSNEIKRKGKKGRKRTLFGVIICLAIAFFLCNSIFARATVTVNVADQSVDLEPTTLPVPVAYEAFTKNSEKTVSVSSVKTVAVAKKATGTIVIYNNYSTEPYELIKTTRFQTANGSVYRLTQDIMVPGKKVVGGKDVPGTINAKVEADLPGSEYNARGGLDLKLPGLIPGTQKYVNIYAQTSANFTGGETGTAPDTGSKEIADAVAVAKQEVQDAAIAEFKKQSAEKNPDDEKVILTDSVVTTSSIGTVKTNNGASEVLVKFTTKAIGLSKNNLKNGLTQILAPQKLTPLDSGLENIKFTVNETPDKSILEGTFTVSAEGAIPAGYAFTPETLKQEIVGKSAFEANDVITSNMPGSSVEISIWPVWKNSLPANEEKLELIIQ